MLETPPRASLWSVQTPQIFERGKLLKAYEAAQHEGYYGTDDASLVEHQGGAVRIVMGSYDNIKLTTPEDLPLAEDILAPPDGGEGIEMRIGFGYDVHRLVEGRPLILGGEEIPYAKGLLGHSDADVLIHALMDALLGAAALGDIGKHFPDSDPAYKGADSMVLLEQVVKLLQLANFQVNNVDVTVVAQAPKLAGYIPAMRRNIAEVLGTSIDDVSVKATTTEGLGFAPERDKVSLVMRSARSSRSGRRTLFSPLRSVRRFG